MEGLAEWLNGFSRRVPEWAVWMAGLIPFAWILWLTLSDTIGVDPVREIEHRLGKIALWFLLGGLAISPLRRFTGVSFLKQRRAVGLLAFTYVCLHIVAWVVLDMGLEWQQAVRDVLRRPYLIFGMIASVLLLPLAATSNKASIRRMGQNWRRLHLLVWPAVFLGIIHYLWQMKIISVEGWIWLGAACVLAVLRRVPKPVRAVGPR